MKKINEVLQKIRNVAKMVGWGSDVLKHIAGSLEGIPEFPDGKSKEPESTPKA